MTKNKLSELYKLDSIKNCCFCNHKLVTRSGLYYCFNHNNIGVTFDFYSKMFDVNFIHHNLSVLFNLNLANNTYKYSTYPHTLFVDQLDVNFEIISPENIVKKFQLFMNFQ